MASNIHQDAEIRAIVEQELPIELELKSRMKLFTKSFTLCPGLWKQIKDICVLDWQSVAFDEGNIHDIPEGSGVYAFAVVPEGNMLPDASYITYVGKAKSLRKRFRQYVYEQRRAKRQHIYEMLNLWKSNIRFLHSTIDDQDDVREVELQLINGIFPPYNRSDFLGIIGNAADEARR
jgi:hypothetical protein